MTLNVRHTPGPERAELAVYLHGLGGSATNFTDLAGLVGVRFPGMAIDLPGFGRSAPPYGFNYTPDSHAEVIATFLGGLGHGSVHLAGNSLGEIPVQVAVVGRSPGASARAVVWGAADKLVTVRKAPRTAAALQRGRLLALPRTGHLPRMEQPSPVARAILGMIDAVDRAVW